MPGGTQSKPLHQVLPEIEYQDRGSPLVPLSLSSLSLSQNSAEHGLLDLGLRRHRNPYRSHRLQGKLPSFSSPSTISRASSGDASPILLCTTPLCHLGYRQQAPFSPSSPCESISSHDSRVNNDFLDIGTISDPALKARTACLHHQHDSREGVFETKKGAPIGCHKRHRLLERLVPFYPAQKLRTLPSEIDPPFSAVDTQKLGSSSEELGRARHCSPLEPRRLA
ncbi:hypothetical protein QC763_0026930 [Podospora pseudopauciseta]|uniref:Uncharacterized protein n=2 Tax=Podospora TaxID=5144 RepID=A0ABR0I3K9_9PEZI|nr:hypothetical protein QC763_0026930 [Podospora pseudopauciseta]KAK4683185.1 hypothetical protein QC764_0026830 [Podospora pseudoanserina]